MAEFVVSKAMVEHVFVDVYSSKPHPWIRAVSTVLASLECQSPDREALIRCQLLADNELDDDTRDQVVLNAANQVVETLRPMLPTSFLRDEFANTLQALFREAMDR